MHVHDFVTVVLKVTHIQKNISIATRRCNLAYMLTINNSGISGSSAASLITAVKQCCN